MVSPMSPDGSLDLKSAAELAEHLVENGHDGLVVNGTTGESPTTTDAEKIDLVRVVVEAVGHRAQIIAGVGTNNTADSVDKARAAEKAGAHGLLVVTPYYNKPPQEGVLAHFTTVADSTDLPVVVYDIPGRSGVPIHTETLLRMASHPRIVAVKDAKGDLFAASEVMSATDLIWYSGDDALNLAHLTQGAVGIISVVGHLAGNQYAEMVAAVGQGNLTRAIEIHRQLIPAVNALMNITQGVIATKAALHDRGLIASAAVRLPMVTATHDQLARVRAGLQKSGLS
ncbi:MAG: 4-hydroxy-tetrahydrodipicolinate synthase [Actinomycetota bacterium]|jgi:4-hydroxy-tetrahydrodipicolinate synthase|nr:4-hydroxy-tetrahydrodipicolinate synthase [Actinomycetota bacterium]